MIRTIRVAPGIGDNIWILQKLINTDQRFIFHLPDSPPKRGKQIFDLLPQVTAASSYEKGLPYRFLLSTNIQRVRKEFRNIRDRVFTLLANTHLEEGNRIEEFLPDLPTSFRIDWKTTFEDKDAAYLRTFEANSEKQLIGIYASAYSTARNWGFWDENGWFELIKKVHKHNKDYVFVIIGAEWDTDLAHKLIELLAKEKIHYINSIGAGLGEVIEIMKLLHYFYAFPSGLGILAPTVGCSVTMFYPEHLEKMINTWAAPEDIENGLYHGTLFCTPDEAFKWARDNKKI